MVTFTETKVGDEKMCFIHQPLDLIKAVKGQSLAINTKASVFSYKLLCQFSHNLHNMWDQELGCLMFSEMRNHNFLFLKIFIESLYIFIQNAGGKNSNVKKLL